MANGEQTRAAIAAQPEWLRGVSTDRRLPDGARVLYTGCGTSFHAAQTSGNGIDALEFLLDPPEADVLVLVSHEGTTPLTIEAAEAFAGPKWLVTAKAESRLAALCDEVVIARDMRPSGPELVDAFARGVMEQGIDVIDIGLASTDLMYYASGALDIPGAMFTASHNPAGYNGVKLCLAGARPIGVDSGLGDVQAVAERVLGGDRPSYAASAGRRSERTLLDEFAGHVLSFIDPADIGTMRVVADTANGMGGLVVPAVFERLQAVELEVMYGDLDGTFPNHPADPLQPANQRDLRARVVSGGFDLGLAFDGDADRVFVVDESGSGLSGSTTTALLASATLRQHPGATILHNVICSRAVPEIWTAICG